MSANPSRELCLTKAKPLTKAPHVFRSGAHARWVHYATIKVKTKRTHGSPQSVPMDFDDRPDDAIRLSQARLAAGFPSARSAATRFGWKYETYKHHEDGRRGIKKAASKYAKAFKVSEGWLLTGEGIGPNSKNVDLYQDILGLEMNDLEAVRSLVNHLKNRGGA